MPHPGDPRKPSNGSRDTRYLKLENFRKGFESYAERENLSDLEAKKALAVQTVTAVRTIGNWLEAAKMGTPLKITPKKAAAIGRALGLKLEDIIETKIPSDGPIPPEPPVIKPWIRTITGRWLIEGGDTSVEPHLRFDQQARNVRGHIEIKQDANGSIVGEGLDHDHDKILLEGQLIGEGSYVRGLYSLQNPRLLVSGVFMLHVQENGREMTGALIQRETGQVAVHGLVLVQIVLKLDENTANTAAFI